MMKIVRMGTIIMTMMQMGSIMRVQITTHHDGGVDEGIDRIDH